MDVTLPTGEVIKNVPEGTTKAQLVEKLNANGYDTSWYKPEKAQEAPAAQERDKSFIDYGAEFLAGATAVPRGALNLVSGESKLGEKIWPTQNVDKESAAYIAGQVLDPAAWAVGGGAMNVAKSVLPAAGAIKTGALGGALGGGAVGVTDDAGVSGAALGGAIGGGIPGLGVVISKLSPKAKTIFNSISATMTKGGRAAVGQTMVLNQLQPAERDAVLQILRQQGVDVSELGSDLTVSQALGKARIGQSVKSPEGARVAALENELAQMPGGEMLNTRYAQQQGVSQDIMNTLSGGRGAADDSLRGLSADDIALGGMKKARADTANKLYPTGEVTGDPALNEIMSRPGVRSAMGIDETSAGNVPRSTKIGTDIPARTEYKTVFTEWQQTPYKEDLPEVFAKYPIKSLQNQYRLMDKEINRLKKTGASVDETRAYELTQAKSDLGKWLAEASPEWAQANRIFSFQSVPVRQAQVGAALKGKMEQSPQAFLKATENIPAQEQLIKGVTGRPELKLSDVFNLGQMSKISGLRNEAQIGEEVKKLQSMVRPDLSNEKAFQLPNLLNIWVAMLNRLSRGSAAATIDDVTEEAAKVLSNPAEMRKLLMKDSMERSKVGKVPVWAAGSGRYAAPAVGLMTGEQ